LVNDFNFYDLLCGANCSINLMEFGLHSLCDFEISRRFHLQII